MFHEDNFKRSLEESAMLCEAKKTKEDQQKKIVKESSLQNN